jgi:hypothetical protein
MAGQAQQADAGTTASDAVVALAVLRRSNPIGFVEVVVQKESVVHALLSAYGFQGCWERQEAYLADFDRAFDRWVQAGNFRLPPLPPLSVEVVEHEDESPILAALPDGTGYVGTRRGFRAAARQQRLERALWTLRNIAGGPIGALGYLAAGDQGSDVGAGFDALLGGAGGMAQHRQQIRGVGQGPGRARPQAAEVRPAGPGAGPKPPALATPPGEPAPATPAPRLENAPIRVVPAPPVGVGKPAPVGPMSPRPSATPSPVKPALLPRPTSRTAATPSPPLKSGEPATPKSGQPALGGAATSPAATANWKDEWNSLVRQAERPVARQSDNGFRTQMAVSSDKQTTVVITEGVVGPQVRGKSTADYGLVLKGEHSTHPVGRQQGEDVGPSAQGSAPATFNLSEMKVFENTLSRAARIAAEQGGTVETRTVMVTQRRVVNGDEVPVTVGVHRTAWLRLPGRDPHSFLEMKAVIDPVTRAVTVILNTNAF